MVPRQPWPNTFVSDIDGLVQDCCNSSALAMELLQSCSRPLILSLGVQVIIIWSQGRQLCGFVFQSVSQLLMTWCCQASRHQQQWYWPHVSRIFCQMPQKGEVHTYLVYWLVIEMNWHSLMKFWITCINTKRNHIFRKNNFLKDMTLIEIWRNFLKLNIQYLIIDFLHIFTLGMTSFCKNNFD